MGANVSRLMGTRNVTVLNAIEDIQKLSQEDIHAEFDRVFEHSKMGLRKIARSPCVDVSEKVIRCIRNNPGSLSKCFSIMESYQQCVSETYQERSDELAAEQKLQPDPETENATLPCPSIPENNETATPNGKKKKRWWLLWIF